MVAGAPLLFETLLVAVPKLNGIWGGTEEYELYEVTPVATTPMR
jgi:hypothetical protein